MRAREREREIEIERENEDGRTEGMHRNIGKKEGVRSYPKSSDKSEGEEEQMNRLRGCFEDEVDGNRGHYVGGFERFQKI